MVYGKIQTMKLSLDKPHKHIELLQRKQDEQGLTASEKDTLLALQQARLDFLEEQFRLAQHKLFASKNEAHPGQDDLFNEVEEITELEQEKAKNEEQQPTDNKKRTRNTKPFAEHIAREVIIHDIDDVSMSSMVCQHVTPSIWLCHEINGLKYITTIPRISARPRTINGV